LLARSPSSVLARTLALALALAPALAWAGRGKPAPAASPLSRLLARTFKAYGGLDALLAVEGIRSVGTLQEGGRRGRIERSLAPAREPRVAAGSFRAVTTFGVTDKETVVLDGHRAWRDGAEVTGLARSVQLRLEAARLFVPALLARERGALVDRGELRRSGRRLRVVELPFAGDAALLAEIDVASGRILRTTARVVRHETVVTYDGFRRVGGILFPFSEAISAPEGERTVALDRVELVPVGALVLAAP
jgi:hypothetical protein